MRYGMWWEWDWMNVLSGKIWDNEELSHISSIIPGGLGVPTVGYDLRFWGYLGPLLRKNIFLLRFHCSKDSSTNKPGSEVKSSHRPCNTWLQRSSSNQMQPLGWV